MGRITCGRIEDLLKNPEDFEPEFVRIEILPYTWEDKLGWKYSYRNISIGISISGEEGYREIILEERKKQLDKLPHDGEKPEVCDIRAINECLTKQNMFLAHATYIPMVSGKSSSGGTGYDGAINMGGSGTIKTTLLLYGTLYKPKQK